MKKNNLLMSAYIAFVFLCFVIRTFVEYSMWDSVVASVTFSSVFLLMQIFSLVMLMHCLMYVMLQIVL